MKGKRLLMGRSIPACAEKGACGSFEPFRRAFPGTVIIALEQNYRSSGAIVAASSALIALNRSRTPKQCFTVAATGEPLLLAECRTVEDELGFVVGRIRALLGSAAVRASQVALLVLGTPAWKSGSHLLALNSCSETLALTCLLALWL